MKTNSVITTINSRIEYVGEITLRSHEFVIDNKIVKKDIVEHAPSVGIIPFLNSDEIILVRQYRLGAQKILLEIPAGKIEGNESMVEAAYREMAEEIGFKGKITFFKKMFLAPGHDTELMSVFIAKELEKIDKPPAQDIDEEIEIVRLPFNEAVKKCLSGEIEDSKTIASLLMYKYTKEEQK